MKISPTSPGGSSSPSASNDLHLARRAAGRPSRGARATRAGDDRRRLRLGARVELPDRVGAEPLDPRLLQPRRARRGEVPHDLQRRHVVALAHVVGQLRDARHHRRHDVHRVGVVLVDQLQRASPRRTCRRARRGCPRAARSTDHMNGPLWYSGPGIMCVPSSVHHQQRVARRDRSSPGCRVEDQLRPAGAAARRHRLPRIRRPRRAAGRRRRRRRASNRAAGTSTRDDRGIDADDQRGLGELDDPVELALRAAATTPAAASRRPSSTRSSRRRTRRSSAARS